MRFSKAVKTINMLYKPGHKQVKTIFLRGKPGIGKTAMAYFLQDMYKKKHGIDYKIIKRRVADLFAEDFSGIPLLDKEAGVTRWLPPDFLPLKETSIFQDTYGILLLDEVNRAKPDVLQALMKVLDRDGFLDNWLVICTGNFGNDANVEEFDTAQERRFFFIDVDENLEDWTNWAREANIDSDVVSFLNTAPQYLHYAYENKAGINAYITPAHWEELSNMFKLNAGDMTKKEIFSMLGQIHLGPVAPAFLDFMEREKIVSINDLYSMSAETLDKIKMFERHRIHQLNQGLVEHLIKLPKITDKDVNMLNGYVSIKTDEDNYLLEDDNYVSIIKTLNDKRKEVIEKLMLAYPIEKERILKAYLNGMS